MPNKLGHKPILLPEALQCLPPKPVKGFLSLWEWTFRPPSTRILKSIWKTKSQNLDKHPNIPQHLEKGKARLKTTALMQKNHATYNKRTIHEHTRTCMSKIARKSHMETITYKYSCWRCMIMLLFLGPFIPFLSFSFFSFLNPKLECSKKTLSDQYWGRERE